MILRFSEVLEIADRIDALGPLINQCPWHNDYPEGMNNQWQKVCDNKPHASDYNVQTFALFKLWLPLIDEFLPDFVEELYYLLIRNT